MSEQAGTQPAGWRDDLTSGRKSLFAGRRPADNTETYRTLTYEVTGRIARITFNRPEQGNAITADTPVELARVVERADLDPRVHVMVVSGRGKGFCGGYDLSIFAENGGKPDSGPDPHEGTVVDPVVQARNHDPSRTWDPMIDYAMMSRFNRGFASLLHADKPTVAKLHGFAVAGGTDIALYADQIICADDTKIGYPPTRVWGIPAAGMWAHRLGDQRAKRLLFTGDCLSGKQAHEWGLLSKHPCRRTRRANRRPVATHLTGADQSTDHEQAGAQQCIADSRGWELRNDQHRLRWHLSPHARGLRVSESFGNSGFPGVRPRTRRDQR